MSSVTMMGEKKRKRRERRKQRLYTHTHIFNKLMKYSRTVLVSGTGHVVEAGIYNCLHLLAPPLPIPFAFCKLLSWSWFFTWWDDPNLHSWRVWAIRRPACIGSLSFPINISYPQGLDALRDLLPGGHAHPHLCCGKAVRFPGRQDQSPSPHSNSLLCLLIKTHEEPKVTGGSGSELSVKWNHCCVFNSLNINILPVILFFSFSSPAEKAGFRR